MSGRVKEVKMNIRNNDAGSVTHEHILNKGFKEYRNDGFNDMGQGWVDLPQFTNGELFINGGYWNYVVSDKDGNKLWEGWWNSNDEFDKTISELSVR